MRLIQAVLILAFAALPAQAQFADFLADWSDAPPSDTRSFTADITATLKARTPWGDITTVETGKYWRNGKGQDRFDDSYGLSTIRDRLGPVFQARIDRQLKLVDIEEKIAPRTAATVRPEPWNILPFYPGKPDAKSAEKMVEGLKARVRTGEDHGVSYEAWTSDALGLVLFFQYKTDHTVFEQRLQNIKFAEPDASTADFRIPSGFRTHITCWSVTDPEHDAPRQTFEPGRDSCK